MNVTEIIGKKYGKLTVLKESEKAILPCGQSNQIILCECECGNIKNVRLQHVIRNKIKSCGCIIGKSNRKEYPDTFLPLSKIWRQMKNRCSENYFEKHLYFNKGITVCDEWKEDRFSFIDWCMKNGYEKKLQLDRKDNSLGYSPNNCRFVTCSLNGNNKDNTFFVTYKGEKIAITLLLREIGLEKHKTTIINRIKRGWNHELAIDTPIKKGNYYVGKRNLNQK